ncbi:MAG TPA: Tat pathway signal protein [Candidatus Sulfotelmatobacter sp.]|nr:Tat pathway signal protein [Candidatus Sulfotelmatobacter sp.]
MSIGRRAFLQGVAATAAGFDLLSGSVTAAAELTALVPEKPARKSISGSPVSLEGHTLVSEFKTPIATWKVYEDLRTREGALVFVSSNGETRQLAKSAEASMPEGTPYLGLALKDIGTTSADLLADRLLPDGDPDPDVVKSAAPPMASAEKNPRTWTTFVGTKEAYDVTPIYRSGNTRTYHPIQYSPQLREALKKGQLYDGLIGGWMPAVRKVIPISDRAYWEVIVFGEVGPNKNKYIVHTWHRTARIEDGKMADVVYGHSYPAYPPARQDPKPEEFYPALLAFADYWDQQLHGFAPATLPQNAWVDMSKHSFAKELMTRPGGIYPKYGAVDRDYAGSEYDGFQDIFTSAIYTNMEWGRLDTARLFIDNYFTEYVDDKGMIDMRGPETAQFGMTLSLVARYFHYTRDSALMLKHRAKIEATAKLLADMHDESLHLPQDNPGYGLIRGWSESDSCLGENPSLYWQPYYANSAFAARGFKDIAWAWRDLSRQKPAPGREALAESWLKRSKTLRDRTIESVEKNIQNDKTPPYIGLFPGTTLTFRESLEKERPSPQAWPHRPYAELLQADILPPRLANLVIDCMRAHGATTLGVVANVWRFQEDGREILGFISYGYAQMLLRLDRIEEFLLFLYSHRYHAHTRGSWTAGEVTGITGDSGTYCVPAQLTIPLLTRWMLVLEDSDEDVLYLAKGVPREWVGSGKEIRIEHAPTRWGRVGFNLITKRESKTVVGNMELSGAATPREVHFKLRLPAQMPLQSVVVNGQPASLGGVHKDSVIITTGGKRTFEVIGRFS